MHPAECASEIKGTVTLRSAGGFGRLSIQARNGFRRLSAGGLKLKPSMLQSSFLMILIWPEYSTSNNVFQREYTQSCDTYVGSTPPFEYGHQLTSDRSVIWNIFKKTCSPPSKFVDRFGNKRKRLIVFYHLRCQYLLV